MFVKIAVVVFSHQFRIRDLSISFDNARMFGVKLRTEHWYRVGKVNDNSVFKIGRLVHTNDLSARETVAAQSWCSKLSRERFSAMALSWLNLPCALKAAIAVSGHLATRTPTRILASSPPCKRASGLPRAVAGPPTG